MLSKSDDSSVPPTTSRRRWGRIRNGVVCFMGLSVFTLAKQWTIVSEYALPLVVSDDAPREKFSSQHDTEDAAVEAGDDRPLFPPPVSEWLDDIDTHPDSGFEPKCGTFKCLFASKRNRELEDDDPTPSSPRYGYLVGQEKPKVQGMRPQNFASTMQGWNFTSELSETFRLQHLLLAPPESLSCSKGLADGLNCAAHRRKPFKATQADGTFSLVVQPLRLAPPDTVLFGCYKEKRQEAYRGMASFAAAKPQHHPVLEGKPLRTFAERLNSDLEATREALKSHRCLATDFQVLVDLAGGAVYHLDFDRCFENKPLSAHYKGCLADLEAFGEDLMRIRSGGALPDATRERLKDLSARAGKDKKKQRRRPDSPKCQRLWANQTTGEA